LFELVEAGLFEVAAEAAAADAPALTRKREGEA
jgi:hypothetical protein